MRILNIEPTPIAEFPFLNAGRGVGDYFQDMLPIHVGLVDRLPEGVAALIATADLQGREDFQYQRGPTLRLLGEWLPGAIRDAILPLLDLPSGEIGVLLAGDFYTVPNLDKRGGSGDVTAVWQAFASEFSWVVGIAGNHDTFGTGAAKPPRFRSPLHFLDGTSTTCSGLTIAGISGIVGDPKRPWRKTEDEFERLISSVALVEPDILLMHDGPDVPELGYRGSSRIRFALGQLEQTLVIRGHAHWQQPLAELAGGLQVLNVDSRVIVLKPSGR